MKNPNTIPYWNDRFNTTSWTDNFGIEQSQLFADVMIANLPQAVLYGSDSLLDVGCALGQLCNTWKNCTTASRVVGYDFSDKACEKAREVNKDIEFTSSYPKEKFDVVSASNVFEHLEDFFPMLSRMSESSNKFIVILVPFKSGIGGEHVREFKGGEFPEEFRNFVKIKDKIIDVYNKRLWDGQQELIVYKKKG